MDLQELLKWADGQMLAHTGKHLSDLQKAILRGVFKHQTYSDIAESYHCSEGHVKTVASQLWKTLSESLGESVDKSNLRSTFDRLRVSNISSLWKDSVQINGIDVCANISHPPEVPKQQGGDRFHPPSNTKPQIDRADAPDIDYCCDRPDELATLKNWIFEKRTRLIAILGISGMGKTAIAQELLSQIEDKFDRVIWKSLRGAPPPETTLKSLIQFFSNTAQNRNNQNEEERLSLLLEYLRNYRCLIILDDLHQVLEKDKLVGHYKLGYENYRNFFETIAELSHQSCLILNTWELPREFTNLKNKNVPVSCLRLEGLGKAANKILEEEGLLDEEKWSELIDIYEGNPHWLKIAATQIKDVFGGKVAEYLQYNPLFLDDLTAILELHLSRLSELERQILISISGEKEPVSISLLLENSDRSSSDIVNAIRSLAQRSLLEKIEGQNSTLFAVKRIFKEYLLERH